MTTHLTISDLLRAHDVAGAVDRIEALLRVAPESPVDADAVRTRYEASRDRLKAVVPPAPFRVVVERVKTP
jgi:hypothetical protein